MLNFLKKYKSIWIIIVIYYSVYTVITSFVEPLGWFGKEDSILKPLGVWGNILILLIPAIITIIYFLIVTQKNRELKKYLGIELVSTGSRRDEAFQGIRQRAKNRIIIVGIGMTNLSRYAIKTLMKQAEKVPIDFLMIDPEFLESNPVFAKKLEEFLDIPNFIHSVRISFNILKSFCEEFNANSNNIHKVRLKVYSTIPTMSMVMIDLGEETAEMVIEFFLYQSGEYRPRFLIKQIDSSDNLFNRVASEFNRLWTISRSIVG